MPDPTGWQINLEAQPTVGLGRMSAAIDDRDRHATVSELCR